MRPGSRDAALAFLASTRYLTDGVPTWRKGLDGKPTMPNALPLNSAPEVIFPAPKRKEKPNAKPTNSKPARSRSSG